MLNFSRRPKSWSAALALVFLSSVASAEPKSDFPEPSVLSKISSETLTRAIRIALGAEEVQIEGLALNSFQTYLAFPWKAHVTSTWDGDMPIKEPYFYSIQLTARKGQQVFQLDCTARDYEGDVAGLDGVYGSVLGRDRELVINGSECAIQKGEAQANVLDMQVAGFSVDGTSFDSAKQIVYFPSSMLIDMELEKARAKD